MTAWIFSITLSNEGMPKLPVQSAEVTAAGLAGDRQRTLKYHGGEARALCLFSLERLPALQQEGHPLYPGSTGENVLIAGLDWNQVIPGARLKLGSQVEVEITNYTEPCHTIRDNFIGQDLKRMLQEVNPGWSRVYARVLTPGAIRVSDQVTLQAA